MKRSLKKVSLLLMTVVFITAIVLSFNSEKASAAPAPDLQSFQIVGVADENLFNQNQYYVKSYLSNVKLPKTIYVVTNQVGYGDTHYRIDGNVYKTATRSKWFPRTTANRVITGWAEYDMLTLPVRNHTIVAECRNYNTGKTMTDTIFISVQ